MLCHTPLTNRSNGKHPPPPRPTSPPPSSDPVTLAEARVFSQNGGVIDPHDAGLSNLIFAPAISRVLELLASSDRHPKFRPL